MVTTLLVFGVKRWGVHLNREIDVHWSHRNYTFEFGPRRIRLGHSMVLEEFEQVLENWKEL